ncbi:MAG: NUDIX hydrolase N-terminal domain-containing protein, partial [Anaerolineae bacterium]
MTLAEKLICWAEKLRDVSALGLHFSKNIYDREHFKTVQDIAMEMHALATDTPLAEMEPLR